MVVSHEVMKTDSKMDIKCIWQYIVFKYNEDKIDEDTNGKRYWN